MTDPADLAQTVRERAQRIIGEPQTDDTRWTNEWLDEFALDVLELVRRLDQAEREAIDWQAACEESQASEADLLSENAKLRIRGVV